MEKPSKQALLTSAFVDIASSMNIPDEALLKMLNADTDYMEKLRNKSAELDLHHARGRNVVQFIQAMDHLYKLVGQKQDEAVKWLHQENRKFQNKSPIEYMSQQEGGLERVSKYLKESSSRH